LEYGRKAINDFIPNITFSGGVAWWLSGDAKSGELEYGRGYDLVNKDRLDLIIPMIFGNSDGTVEKVVDYSDDFLADKVSSVIGISLEDYDYSKFNNIIQRIRDNRKESKYLKEFVFLLILFILIGVVIKWYIKKIIHIYITFEKFFINVNHKNIFSIYIYYN